MKGSLISTLGVFIETAVTSLVIHGKILILIVGLGFTLFPRIGNASCNYLTKVRSFNNVWHHFLYYCNDGRLIDYTTIDKPGFTLLTLPQQTIRGMAFETTVKQDQLSCEYYSPEKGSSKRGTFSRIIKIRDDSNQAIYTVTLNIELGLATFSASSGRHPVFFDAHYSHSTVLDLDGATVDDEKIHGSAFIVIETRYPFNANSCKP